MKNKLIIKNKKSTSRFYFENKLSLIPKSKRSQIGTTLTWFTAFIIIFFIMIIFLSASIYSSGRKKVSVGWDEITLKEYSGNLEMQRQLFNILNSRIEFIENSDNYITNTQEFSNKPIPKEYEIKGIVYNGKEARVKDILRDIDMYGLGSDKKKELIQKLKKQTEDILKDSLVGDCYVFSAVYGIDPEETIKKVSGMQGANYFTTLIEKSTLEFSSFSETTSSYSGYAEKQKLKLLETASEITLLRDSTMNVFGFDEKENQRIKIKFYSGKCL